MTKYLFENPQFIKTAMKQEQYPVLKASSGEQLPEIAFAGRSNVGKSTLINHLIRYKGMAKTSSTPGKTQGLNFFTINEELVFTDLPGYGYAKVSKKVKEGWGPMVQTYLKERTSLQLILFLFDIRREPTQDDLDLMKWIIYYEKAVILVLTKVDKVPKNRREARRKAILDGFGVENLHTTYYSASKNIGRQKLISLINEALIDEQKP